jgi:hypothetical protein
VNRALLYADWCCARHALRSSAKAAILAVALTAAVSLLGDDVSVYDIDATGFVCSLEGMLLGLGALFVAPRLFYADEQGGWGEFRLALPVTRSRAVGSRFAIVAAIVAVMAVAAQGLGLLVVLATRLLPHVFGTWTVAASLPAQSLLVAAVMLAMVGLQMAVYFALGVERGRFVSMIPVLGITLAFVALSRSGTMDEGGILAGLAQQASPSASVVVVAVMACVGVYLLSLVASRQAFARREL